MSKLLVPPTDFCLALSNAAELSSRGARVGPARLVRLYRASGVDASLQVLATDGANILCRDIPVDGPSQEVDLLIEATKLAASGLAAKGLADPVEILVKDSVFEVRTSRAKIKTRSIADPSWSFEIGFDGMVEAGQTSNRWDVLSTMCKYVAVLEKTHAMYAHVVMLDGRSYVPGMTSQVRGEVSLFSTPNEYLPCALTMPSIGILAFLGRDLSVMVNESSVMLVDNGGFAKLQRAAVDVKRIAGMCDKVFGSLSVAGEIVLARDALRRSLQTVLTGFSNESSIWGTLKAVGDDRAVLSVVKDTDEVEVELPSNNTGKWKFPINVVRLSQFADRSDGEAIAVRSMRITGDATDRWKSVVHFVDDVLHEATGIPVGTVGTIEEIE